MIYFVSQHPPADPAKTDQLSTLSKVVDEQVEVVKECPMCPSYKTQLTDMSDQLKKKEEYIERLKEDMSKMEVQPTTTKKVIWKSIAYPKTNKRESNNCFY